MITHNSAPAKHENVQELEALYAGLIGGTALYEKGFDLWGKHAQAWGDAPALEISQGGITGTFTRDGVEFAMGSRTAALLVAAQVKTPDEERRLELFLKGNEPAFSIRSLPEDGPTLQIEPTTPDYIELPIDVAFNWDAIVSDARQYHELESTQPLYLVAFRSQLKVEADKALLLEHDARAHDAAKESPALLHYFAGEPDEQGRALSFCLWSDEAEAKSISRDSRHAAATQMTTMYESYSLEKYDVHHDNGPVLLMAK